MPIDAFPDATLERVAVIVGDFRTGSTITQLLNVCRLREPEPAHSTKWRRVHAALEYEQSTSGSGACLLRLVQEFGRPQAWPQKDDFEQMRAEINPVLAYNGYELQADGTMTTRPLAKTHDEANAATVQRLRKALADRGGHAEVFKYCSEQLVAEDCFFAVQEATKGLAERLREMTDLDLDGHELVDAALFGKSPMVALNALTSDTQWNEQRGIGNLMKGCFSAFRNPTAHEPRIVWHVSEADTLDLLSTLSLIHRRLDVAVVLRRA